ncbi:MAG: hypothetical protein KUG77_26985, partial [Nannocystaceae bacterium]|nr:hypothetical protein [Nannocystaceae bacterium]
MDDNIEAIFNDGGDTVRALRPFLRPHPGKAGRLVFDPMLGVTRSAPHWGQPREVNAEVIEALANCDDFLRKANVTMIEVRVPAQPQINGKTIERLTQCHWFSQVEQLDLSGNRVSGKALSAIAKVARSLRVLTLNHVKLGKALGKLSGLQALEELSVEFSLVDSDALAALLKATLPRLAHLGLFGFGQYCTWKGLGQKLADHRLELHALGPSEFAPLTDPAHAARWKTLRLGYVDFGDSDGFADVELPSLEKLEIHRSKLTRRSANALMRMKLPKLVELKRDGGFPPEDLRRAPWLRQLQRLCFDNCEWLDDEDLGGLLGACSSLEALRLTHAGVSSRTIAALAALDAPLTRLRLMNNLISDEDVVNLLGAPWANTLVTLGLSGNEIRRAGTTAIAKVAASLQALGLSKSELEDQDLEPLLGAPWLPKCHALALANNRLSDKSADGLAQIEFSNEVQLQLDGNAFSKAKARELSA